MFQCAEDIGGHGGASLDENAPGFSTRGAVSDQHGSFFLGADALSYGESERMFLVEIIGEIPLVSHEKHEDRGEAGAAGIHILHTDVLEFE